MNRLTTSVGAAAAALALMAAPAMASGGSGGGGGGTVSGGGGGTVSGGGGGTTVPGGGGGGKNRGVTDPTVTAPAPAPAPGPVVAGTPCATFANTSVPVGYYLTFAALWHDYGVRSCNSAGLENVSVRVTDTNRATGNVDYSVTVPWTLDPNGNVNDVEDNDFAPFSVDYDVKMQILDDAGHVLDTSLLSATTPPAR